jgi:hypothetical protein
MSTQQAMIHLSYKIETKVISKIVDKLVLKHLIDQRVYNNLPPILRAGDEPAVQSTVTNHLIIYKKALKVVVFNKKIKILCFFLKLLGT